MNKEEMEEEVNRLKENAKHYINSYAEIYVNSGYMYSDEYCISYCIGNYINSELQDNDYTDLIEWAKDNESCINDTIGRSDDYQDIKDLLQEAQYNYYYDEIIEDIDGIVEIYAYNYILERLEEVEEIYKSQEALYDMINELNSIDETNSYYDIEAICNKFLGVK